jgi:integrase
MPELELDGAHMRAFAELSLHVGFRAGELLSRRYGHVSFEDASVLINQTRAGRDRRVPLNSRALAILKDLRQGAGNDERIFDPRRTGRRRRQMLYRFKAATERAGLTDFHYHDLRHTCATRLRAAGVHEFDIAALLGHSTTRNDTRGTSVPRGYAHAVRSRLKEAVELPCTLKVVEFRREERSA